MKKLSYKKWSRFVNENSIRYYDKDYKYLTKTEKELIKLML